MLTRVYCLCLQEYEEKLARLQADYNAEQQSRAKLQEDIAVLLSEYKSKTSEKAVTSRGSSQPAETSQSEVPFTLNS